MDWVATLLDAQRFFVFTDFSSNSCSRDVFVDNHLLFLFTELNATQPMVILLPSSENSYGGTSKFNGAGPLRIRPEIS